MVGAIISLLGSSTKPKLVRRCSFADSSLTDSIPLSANTRVISSILISEIFFFTPKSKLSGRIILLEISPLVAND